MRKLKRFEVAVLLIAIAIAVFFRLYRLDAVPMGLWCDEAANGVDALGVLEGKRPIYFEANNGREPLYIYLVAVSIALLGRNPLAIRVVTAVVGIVTVPVMYLAARELFRSTSGRAGVLASFASLCLASSYSHTAFSRLGYRANLLPLLSLCSFYFLWRGLNRGMEKLFAKDSHLDRPIAISFCLSGFFVGLSIYTYLPSRFLPIVVVIVVPHLFIVSCLSKTHSRARHPIRCLRFLVLGGILPLFVVAALVFAPLGHYFLNHLAEFSLRFSQTSIFSAANLQNYHGSPVRAFLDGTLKTLAMYLGVLSDPDPRENPAGRPIFDPIILAFLAIGIILACARSKKTPYAFVLCWAFVMSLPGTLGVVPSSLRVIGALPALYILAAIALDETSTFFGRAKGHWLCLTYTLCILLLLVSACFTYRDYFGAPFDGYELRQAFSARFVDMASVMNGLDRPDSIWILPLAPGITDVGDGCMSFVIDYLYQGVAPHKDLLLEEPDVATDLSVSCDGRERAMLITYYVDEPWFDLYSDAKGVMPFLLNKYGHAAESHSYERFGVSMYELPARPSFSLADGFQPMNVEFGQELRLIGVAIGGSSQNPTSTPEEVNSIELPSGKSGWVVLRWEALSEPSQDYKVGAYLVDQRGRRMGQVDKLLFSNYWQPTSRWMPGQAEMDYYTLPSLAGTPPGWYDIHVAVYDEETMERLPILHGSGSAAARTVPVGRLHVMTPLEPAVVEPTRTLGDAGGRLAADIQLLGYDLPTRISRPGDTLSVALYWKALQAVHGDYVITMQLRDQQGRVWAEEQGRPAYGNYPTTKWGPGEVLRDWHDLSLSPELPGGPYELALQVIEAEHVLGEMSLDSVELEARPHMFAVPDMQHRVEVGLGGEITLLGYDLSADKIEAGETLSLTLYWLALTEMDKSYTVFTHLLDREGRIWGQQDSLPGAGQLPTTGWIEREIIVDYYEIPVSSEAPSGEYVLETGMYQWETGERLPVFDQHGMSQADRIVLGTVEVVSST